MNISNNNIALSIVIPVYNGELFITGALETVKVACERFTEETGLAAEIICVDDDSSDNSVEVIQSQFKDITLLRNEENLGFAPTCNRGLQTASGEFLYLLNQDTRSQPESLLTLYNMLCSDARIGIVGPKFVGFDGHLQCECRCLPTYSNVFYELSGLAKLFPNSEKFASLRMRWFDHRTEALVQQPMGAAMLFRRSLLDEVGPLDESFPIFFNDVDWAKRILDAGYINLYCPTATVEHYIGSATKPQKPRMIRESHRSLYHYFEKWQPQDGLWESLILRLWRIGLSVSGALRSWYWSLRS